MSTNHLLSHPDRPLAQHLDEVARIARLVLGRHPACPFSGVGLDAPAALEALAGSHDVAKATAFFQDYIFNTEDFERRARAGDPLALPALKTHTPLGAFLALRHWSGMPPEDDSSGSTTLDSRLLGLLMMIVVRGHHSRLPSRRKLWETLDFPQLEAQLRQLDPAVASCHPGLAGVVAGVSGLPFEQMKSDAEDRLAESLDELEATPLERRIQYRLAVQFCFSCLLEADKALLIHRDEAEYRGKSGVAVPPTVVEDHPPSGAGSPHLVGQRSAALAEVISDAATVDLAAPRPRVLTLPTGLGKTRCAAAWAFHLRDRIEQETSTRPKIVVVLPFLSIIEQTARVYRRELLGLDEDRSDETLGVSHSLSVRDYGDLEEDERDRAEFALDTWRSDVILTTFDQFLLALMDPRTKHQQRFQNLCDAVIVLDEVQAFPCRLWHPVGRVLRELGRAGRSHILLMTATQPGLLKPEDVVPVIRDPGAYAQSRYRLEYDPTERRLLDWLPELDAEIRQPENAGLRKWLVVLNTRQAAQDAYRFFKQSPPLERLFLLSSDIVPVHRLGRVDEIRNAASCLVISTQCVEAGVDLDMDRIYRDFGPLDSLVQVAGRCNRHGLRPRALVRVVCLRDGARRYCDYIYDPTLLDETAASLRDGSIDEEQMAGVVEDYFRRLHRRKDTGRQTTEAWSRFEHDDLNVSRLLRGDQDQVAFVVGKLDPTLRGNVEAAFAVRDRWQRRRELRRLAPRIALITVSVWRRREFDPGDIADPVPEGRDDPAFWFLHDDAYHEETGLCPRRDLGHLIF